jgi:hypothetical protein
MGCPSCGEEIAPSHKFCPSCAGSVGSPSIAPTRTAEAPALDGKRILMLGPGFHEYGEHWHSANEQFGMYRAAAWLKATGREVRFVNAALPVILPARLQGRDGRLRDMHSGAPIVREMDCGNGEGPRLTKLLRYYGVPLERVKRDVLAGPPPDEVWVGSGLTYHYETSWQLVHLAKQLYPGIRVRMGGIYPSLCPDHARGSGADVWVGEIRDASDFWPDYSLAPNDIPLRTIKLSSGCTVPRACSFCAVKVLEPRFTWRAPDAVEEYVRQEMGKGVRVLQIWASQLLQPPRIFVEIMERLHALQVEQGVKLHLYASEGIQPSLFSPAIARKMIQAGFSTLTIPMESVEPDTLKRYNKPSTLGDYHKCIQIAKEAHFSWIGAFVMIGTPQQSLDELVHAVVDCWFWRVSPILMQYSPVPGTQDWEDPRYTWIWKGKDLAALHGSLWPAARPDLTALELEEVVAIARAGYEDWSALPQADSPFFRDARERSRSRVTEALFRWCDQYGLRTRGVFRNLDEASPHRPTVGSSE